MVENTRIIASEAIYYVRIVTSYDTDSYVIKI